MAEQKGGTPLRMLVEKIMVLTLPIFPRREEKMRYHLVEECGVVSGVSFFHGKVGLQPGDVSERFSEKELSMMDFLYLSPELNDEVAQNIAENHLAMIRHAYEEESGARHVLFMEDDARVDREVFSAEQSRWLRHFLERSDTDMLHLGCMPFSAGLYRYPYVMQNLSMTLCAHAYVLTRRGMARILAYAEKHPIVPFDRVFHDAGVRVHTAYPMVCFQNRTPALYKRFQTIVPVFHWVSFRTVSTTASHLSILLPVLAVMMILCSVGVLSHRTIRYIAGKNRAYHRLQDGSLLP